jgi:hypothetical protein
MAFPDFHGDTFVAFCDISGFKNLMSRNSARAIHSLGKFYETAFRAVRRTSRENPIYGLVVSDCAILVAENRNGIGNRAALNSLLSCIKEINKGGLEHDLMLTTSIAYGEFHYEQRVEFFGLEKNMITGAAYIEAFKNQSSGKPRLRSGECRLVPLFPEEITRLLEENDRQGVLRMMIKERNHYYFYWMRDTPEEIREFNEAYENTENLKYVGIRLLLRGSRDIQITGES